MTGPVSFKSTQVVVLLSKQTSFPLFGIAEQFHQAMSDIYCAGLWEAYLLRGLVWQMEDPQNSRPSKYRAPTWSWASVDGEVFWTNSPRVKSNIAKKTEVIDCEVLEVNSIASFSRVKDGTLKISAVTKEVIWDGTLIHFREGLVPDSSVASAAIGVGWTAGDIIALARPDVTEENLSYFIWFETKNGTYVRIGLLVFSNGEDLDQYFEGCMEQTVTIK
ncbi:hypothetical protein OEA41_005072 [Lepraria neglecta]|uniref:Heterokaryon incompatibility domain-containing protein n=1 Tax=Lepraria neglecta TaxID=209136 RepID=A0AAE0DGF3_9LECA|nr:hypothetical protein OEA41_005072 [Lepraria neglecta]